MKVLGLDLGTNSIGWALVDHGNSTIVAAGVRIFKMGVIKESLGKGDKEESLNAQRRMFRQLRRQHFRRRLRKLLLLKELRKEGWCPMGAEQWEAFRKGKGYSPDSVTRAWFALNPYELRARAVHEALEPHELGRVLYHLSQRRGFESSSRSVEADEDGVLFTGKDGKTGINETRNALGKETLGSYLNTLRPEPGKSYVQSQARIRNRYTTRDMYADEFKAIWEFQKNLNPGLTEELRLKYGGYKKRGDAMDGILFFRRPLRSQKGARGKCIFEKRKERCNASHPLAEQFRVWQFVNQVEQGENKWDQSTREKAFAYLMSQSKAVKFSALRKNLKLADASLRFNYDDETSCPAAPTTAQLAGKDLFGAKRWVDFTEQEREDIWHVLIDFDDRDRLKQYAASKWGLNEAQVLKLAKVRFDTKYASLSRKAIKNILPYLERGLQYSEAVAMGGVRAAFREDWYSLTTEKIERFEKICLDAIRAKNSGGIRASLTDALTSDSIGLPIERMKHLYHHSELDKREHFMPLFPVGVEADRRILKLKNPVVVKALFEVRKVLNALIKEYGKPDVVRIEMARDLKNTRSRRFEIQREQRRLEARNAEYRKRLEEYNFRPTHENLLKYALCQECNYTCVYTGRSIGMDDLFKKGIVQIEHIRPWSRSLDDSFMNKTLCFADENRKKGDRTPYEFYSQMGPEKWAEVKDRALRLFHTAPGWPDRYKKFKRFVDEKWEDEGFVQRQLNDTRFIAKEVGAFVKQVFPKVETYPGQMTAKLRAMWGMNSILNKEDASKNRDDHRHHAVDALVLACSEVRFLQELTHWNQYGERTGSVRDFPKPWPLFRQDAERVIGGIWASHDQPRAPISTRNVVIELPNGRKTSNKGVSVRGALHLETVFGKRHEPITGAEAFHFRKPLESITDETQLNDVVDKEIRELLKAAVERMGGFEGQGKNRKIPKGAFFSTNEHGERLPLVFLP
ncbi:type II CRISPR RNA-guided endonuclease Cas9, partial [bacterium]|nr:type II CRISPR RNA-guided endonuclease Cas9 [bacterium]